MITERFRSTIYGQLLAFRAGSFVFSTIYRGNKLLQCSFCRMVWCAVAVSWVSAVVVSEHYHIVFSIFTSIFLPPFLHSFFLLLPSFLLFDFLSIFSTFHLSVTLPCSATHTRLAFVTCSALYHSQSPLT